MWVPRCVPSRFARRRIVESRPQFKKTLAYREEPQYSYFLHARSAPIAGWSSLVARRAHNPKVVGSNPAPATIKDQLRGHVASELFCCLRRRGGGLRGDFSLGLFRELGKARAVLRRVTCRTAQSRKGNARGYCGSVRVNLPSNIPSNSISHFLNFLPTACPECRRPRLRRLARCRFGGCGSFRRRGVAKMGVVAIAAGRQLGVLLGTLRLWGLWQADLCHNPNSRNALSAEIATTPIRATPWERKTATTPKSTTRRKVELRTVVPRAATTTQIGNAPRRCGPHDGLTRTHVRIPRAHPGRREARALECLLIETYAPHRSRLARAERRGTHCTPSHFLARSTIGPLSDLARSPPCQESLAAPRLRCGFLVVSAPRYD